MLLQAHCVSKPIPFLTSILPFVSSPHPSPPHAFPPHNQPSLTPQNSSPLSPSPPLLPLTPHPSPRLPSSSPFFPHFPNIQSSSSHLPINHPACLSSPAFPHLFSRSFCSPFLPTLVHLPVFPLFFPSLSLGHTRILLLPLPSPSFFLP